MAHLIDKDALVAEIERRIKEHHSGYLVCLKDILSFIDTLEVKEGDIISKEEKSNLMRKCVHNAYQRGYKTGVMITTNEIIHKQEVDLEKEVDDWWNAHYSGKNYTFEGYAGHYLENSTVIEIAKHFFELGLKAQKGE